jgi:hypothetical protein
MRLRRFAAVVDKPLKLLMWRFVAAVLRRFAGVPKKPTKTMCGGSAAVAVLFPPYPYRRSAAPVGRAAGA